MEEHTSHSSVTYRRTKQAVHRYGLGLLFAANIFGAGSVYIMTSAGSNFGYALMWVMPLALLVGLAMHEMSARLAVIDEPLMFYIRDVIGERASKPLAVTIAFVMQFWSVANYALAGLALAWLVPGLENVLISTVLCAALGIALVELRVYSRVEAAIAVMVLGIFASYLIILANVSLPLSAVASGLVPAASIHFGYMTAIIAILGTTVYYPNFFIQSSMKSSKNWNSMSRYRRDHTFGLTSVVLLSAVVVALAAVTVPSGTPTLTSPAEPLVEQMGSWALDVFIVGVGLASFSSATGTLFGAGFMVPQAWGRKTRFGDPAFRYVVHSLIALSLAIALTVLTFTDFTPVQLALTMPAVNGIIGLPITVLALYGAMRKFYDLETWEEAIFLGAVLVMFVASALTARGLLDTILSFG